MQQADSWRAYQAYLELQTLYNNVRIGAKYKRTIRNWIFNSTDE